MKRWRRLRKLVPDGELIRRRAAGEPLRELAFDYDVAHTTLMRYFERTEVAKQIKQAAAQLRAEREQARPRCLGRAHFPPTPCTQPLRGLARRARCTLAAHSG